MKKITEQSVKAFYDRRNFKKQNMEIITIYDRTFMLLHGNTIAILEDDNTLRIANCGWFTYTTKERLNGLINVSIYQKNWKWYLNGKLWDGKLTTIK